MADESRLNTTQIVVAVIGVFGTVAVALIANSDKLFRHADIPKPAIVAEATPTPVATPAATVDISGYWHDDEGEQFAFDQTGDSYTYRQIKAGKTIGGGSGRLTGRALKHSFSAADGGGTCEAAVTEDGALISGTCREGANAWPFSIRRGST